LPISDANQDIELWQVCKWISTLGVAVKNKETTHEKKNIVMIFKSKKINSKRSGFYLFKNGCNEFLCILLHQRMMLA
jgi:hypothetical protein